MKRDDDLLRRILLEYEAWESYQILLQPRLGMTADEQKWLGHVYLLVDAGLVVESGEHAVRISSKGHDYLATIKDEQNWKRTKDVAAKVGGVTLGIMGDIAVSLMKQKIAEVTGLPIG